jgi:septal ring factor EnvC (AmiA/AmiB activator)
MEQKSQNMYKSAVETVSRQIKAQDDRIQELEMQINCLEKTIEEIKGTQLMIG